MTNLSNLEILYKLLIGSIVKEDKKSDNWKVLSKVFYKEKKFKDFDDLEFIYLPDQTFKFSSSNDTLNKVANAIIYFDNGLTINVSMLTNPYITHKVYEVMPFNRNYKMTNELLFNTFFTFEKEEINKTMKMLQEYE